MQTWPTKTKPFFLFLLPVNSTTIPSMTQNLPSNGYSIGGGSVVLGNRFLTADCDFSLLKSQMNSKGGDTSTMYHQNSRNQMAVLHVPHIANARSIDEMRRKL